VPDSIKNSKKKLTALVKRLDKVAGRAYSFMSICSLLIYQTGYLRKKGPNKEITVNGRVFAMASNQLFDNQPGIAQYSSGYLP
jgi:hypothetical protein